MPLRRRHLVQEGLADELVVARADAAPGMHAHAALLADRVGLEVRDVVEVLAHPDPADVVAALGRREARRRRHRVDVLGDDPVMPAHQVLLVVEARLHDVVRHRPRTRRGQIVLAGEHQLHRLLEDVGDHHRLHRSVRPDAPAEAAAEQLVVDLDLVGRGLEHAGRRPPRPAAAPARRTRFPPTGRPPRPRRRRSSAPSGRGRCARTSTPPRAWWRRRPAPCRHRRS